MTRDREDAGLTLAECGTAAGTAGAATDRVPLERVG